MSSRHRGSIGPSSLNYSVRMRENERIERENHKIAQRLYESKGHLKKKDFDEQFGMQQKYKNNIQKVRRPRERYFGDISIMNKTNKLPPLNGNSS